ncbi:MAG: purine-nucleoside phosphorylase [Pseudomonadota bacterium]
MEYETFFPKVEEIAKYFQKQIKLKPKLLLVLTGGAHAFIESLTERQEFHSSEIPHFPEAKAEGHTGKIIVGKFQKIPLIVMQGRYHYYEGHSPQAVVFPYFVFGRLGIKTVVTTNAVGGINASYEPGDIVLVKDHINMMFKNPLIGIAIQREKNQFTSMVDAYDEDLRKLALEVAKEQGLNMPEAVYMGVTGPSYETKAEIKAFRALGADTIGMSSIFEVIACKYLRQKLLTINCITNHAADIHRGEMKHSDVLKEISKAQAKITKLLEAIIPRLQLT